MLTAGRRGPFVRAARRAKPPASGGAAADRVRQSGSPRMTVRASQRMRWSEFLSAFIRTVPTMALARIRLRLSISRQIVEAHSGWDLGENCASAAQSAERDRESREIRSWRPESRKGRPLRRQSSRRALISSLTEREAGFKRTEPSCLRDCRWRARYADPGSFGRGKEHTIPEYNIATRGRPGRSRHSWPTTACSLASRLPDYLRAERRVSKA